MKYIFFGDGPLTVMGGVEGLAFLNSKYVNASDDYPDIELNFVSLAVTVDGGHQLKNAHGLTDDFYNKTFAPYNFENLWTIAAAQLRPRSRGKFYTYNLTVVADR